MEATEKRGRGRPPGKEFPWRVEFRVNEEQVRKLAALTASSGFRSDGETLRYLIEQAAAAADSSAPAEE